MSTLLRLDRRCAGQGPVERSGRTSDDSVRRQQQQQQQQQRQQQQQQQQQQMAAWLVCTAASGSRSVTSRLSGSFCSSGTLNGIGARRLLELMLFFNKPLLLFRSSCFQSAGYLMNWSSVLSLAFVRDLCRSSSEQYSVRILAFIRSMALVTTLLSRIYPPDGVSS